MAYKLATAFVEIEARGVKGVDNAIDGIGAKLSGLGSTILGTIGIPLGIASAIAAAQQFMASARAAYDAEARLRTAIAATGGTAGKTADELMDMANAMQEVTMFDSGDVVTAMSRLLSFTKITGDTFDRTIKAAADLSASGFGSIESAAMRLGRALQDPIHGLGALRGAGITFTDAEKELIKSLVESNRLLEAQAMILKAVDARRGGAAEALGATPSGRWEQVKNAIGDVGKDMGKNILPIATQVSKIFLDISKGVLALVKSFTLVNDSLGGWPVKLGIVFAVISSIVAVVTLLAPMFMTIVGAVSAVVGFIGVWPAILVGILGTVALIAASFVDWGAVLKWLGDELYQLSLWAVVFVQNWQDAIPAMIAGAKFLAMYMLDLFRDNATYIWGYFAGRAMRAIADLVVWIADKVYQVFEALTNALINLFKSARKLLEDALAGKLDIGKSITDGLGAAFDEVLHQIKRVDEGFEDGFNKTMKGLKLDPSDANKKRLEEFQQLFGKLQKAKDELEAQRAGMFKLPDQKAARREDERKRAEERKLELPSGLTGLTEAWSQLQEAMLKKDDPQEQMARGIENIDKGQDDLLDELLTINRDGIKLKDVAVA